MQEEDVIGVLNSTDIAQLLPLGDRILVEVSTLHWLLHHLKAAFLLSSEACFCYIDD